MEDKIAIQMHTFALGDSICAIPTINKLSKMYDRPITVFNDWSHLLIGHPNVLECKNHGDSTDGYIVHETFHKDLRGNIEKKHNAIDIRQFHAWDLGISLTGDEMNCDLYCEKEYTIESDNYIIIHPSKTWDSRTWDGDKWQNLTNQIIGLGLDVVIVGNDIGQKEWNSDGGGFVPKDVFDIKGGINLINKTTIPELRWLMNKAFCVITMDSGILHVAGTTDCNIIQLGSSLNHKLRAPWRNGSQDYKYQYISGSCTIACGSNLKYGLKEHNDIHGIPPLTDCREGYDEFLCHSSVNDVVNSIIKIDGFNNIDKNIMLGKNKVTITYTGSPRVFIDGDENGEYLVEFIDDSTKKVIHSDTIKNNMWTACSREWFTNWVIKIDGKTIDKFNLEGKKVRMIQDSKAMGDTIAWTPYAVEFANKYKCKVILTTHHNEWFENMPIYKDIDFVGFNYNEEVYAKYHIGWYKDFKKNNWDNPERNPTPVNIIPLQQAATDILGLEFNELNFGIDMGDNKRPIKSKYVVFGPQATAGCKEWDIKKWEELSVKFIEKGFKVVVCSLHSYNIPNTIECNGSLEDTATHLKHADIFIGLGSGLSWLNWALGKYTYMINGFAEEGHEFTSKLTKITNNLCIKCWNDPVHVFDPGDWNWCPVYKGTKLQHICQQSITVDQVLKSIKWKE